MPADESSKTGPDSGGPQFQPGPDWRHFLEAVTGFEIRTFRTIRDLVVRPFAVADETLAGNRLEYLGQVRLFLFLIGVQTLLFGLTGFYGHINVEQLLGGNPDVIRGYSALLAQNGHSIAEVDNTIRDWFNFTITPLSAASIVCFALFFKLLDRRFTLFGHALLLVIINNVASLLTLPLAVIAMIGTFGFGIYSAVLFVVNLGYLLAFVWHYFRRSTTNGILKMLATIPAYLLVMVLTGITMWVSMNAVAKQQFGTGFFSYAVEYRVHHPKTKTEPSRPEPTDKTEPSS